MTASLTEIELKFQVPPARAAAVARAVATSTAERIRLQAAYADTADRRLAAAGLALRLRREGAQWVQTLKGRGDGLMGRLEHEVAVSAMPAMPAFDAKRHAGTPVGEQLLALLADGAAVQVIYRTDIQRVRRTLRSAGALVELAHDRGHIEAGDPATGGAGRRRVAVDEVEFELKAGPAASLVALASRWVARHALWWDVRTKSERGFRLAEGLEVVPAVRATPSAVTPGLAPARVLATALQDALAQVLPNAAEIIDGCATPDHLHQLRVGLRRLRSLLREAAPLAGDGAEALRALERDWAEPFGRLGAARDADALAQCLWPGVDARLAAAGLPPLEPPAAAAAIAADPGDSPATLLQSASLQSLLLRSLAAATPPPTALAGDEAGALALSPEAVAGLLKPLWKKLRRGARRIAEAEPESLHGLRKRAKRLRYLLEALAPLLRRKATAGLLSALRVALDRLGEINDLHTAELTLQALPAPTPSTWFALGLLGERRRSLLPQAQRALDAVFALPPPWR